MDIFLRPSNDGLFVIIVREMVMFWGVGGTLSEMVIFMGWKDPQWNDYV